MGWRQTAIVTNLVIIFGNDAGLFEYDGTPRFGNPPINWAVSPSVTTDPFGNPLPNIAALPPGGGFSAAESPGGGLIANMSGGAVSFSDLEAAAPFFLSGSITTLHTTSPSQLAILTLNSPAADTGETHTSLWLTGANTSGPSTPGQPIVLFGANDSGGNPPVAVNVCGSLGFGSVSAGVPVINNTMFLAPSGDTSGATDTANITGLYTAGVKNIYLLPGNFYLDNFVGIPSGCSLQGLYPVQADTSSNYGAGSLALQGAVITAAGAMTGASPPAGALIGAFNSSATQGGGQVIANLSIEANTTASGSGVNCILLHGALGAGVIDNVVLHRSDGACLRIQTDSGTGKVPDQWRFSRVVAVASRSSHGIQADNIPDSTFTDCLSHNNALNGWDISGSVNTTFIGCRGENNTNNGFAFHGQVGAAEDTWLTGCSTQLNQDSGFLFDAAAHTAQGAYLLTGCRSASDGLAAAGILAGFYDDGCKSVVVLTGCSTLENSGGTVPAYGAYEGSVAFGMALTGCRMQGATAATHDDATNTHALSNLSAVPF